MAKITWVHVPLFFLVVTLVLGVIALVFSDKELELKASHKELVLRTKAKVK